MNVLIVVEPGVDGVFRHVEELCRFLFTRGISVHLAYSSLRGSAGLVSLVAFVRERGGQTLDLRVSNAPCPGDAKAFFKLHHLARTIRPEVIHTHSSKAGVLGRMLALTGIKGRYFYTAHAYYGMGGARGVGTTFFNAIEMIFGRVGGTISISSDESAFATKRLKIPDRLIHVIHNPVDTTKFRPPTADERAAIRAKFNIPAGALVLGSVGRLSFQKDPVTMYRAVAEAMKNHESLWFCQVGRGEMEGELAALSTQLGINARMANIPYLESTAEIYRAFDAFIITSRYEAGWPFVVLEAMASNLPILVTAGPGTSDISHGGLSHCWNAAPGDTLGVARAIDSWVIDAPNHRPINHRQVAGRRFSAEVLFGAILELYEKGINPHFSCEKKSGT